MPATAHALLRLFLATVCLLALGACAHLSPSSARAWAGDYTLGDARLQLRASGDFDYQGGSCFRSDSDSDVGMPDEFGGRFRVEGDWIVLEPLTGAHIKGCSGLGLKLYALRVDGHRYLLDEGNLRALVNEVRDGRSHERFFTWHRGGEPEAFTAPLSDWLPRPYAGILRQPPPAGQVIAVGPVTTRTRYGAAGRIDGEESAVVLTVDIGRRDGAFEGMRTCVEGGPAKVELATVSEEQSTVHWAWATGNGSPPKVGTRVGGACAAP